MEKRGSIPVFGNRNNTIIGGFAFKRYWALPVVLLMIIGTAASNGGSQIATPNWWPILNHNVNKLFFETVILGALPIYAVVGYTASTFTRTRKEKTLFFWCINFPFWVSINNTVTFRKVWIHISNGIIIIYALCT